MLYRIEGGFVLDVAFRRGILSGGILSRGFLSVPPAVYAVDLGGALLLCALEASGIFTCRMSIHLH